MKQSLIFIILILITATGFSQEALYLKYECSVHRLDGEPRLEDSIMNNSSIEVASDDKKSWMKSTNGSFGSMIFDFNPKEDQLTIVMEGMGGQIVYQGSPDDLKNDDNEEEKTEYQYFDVTKEINGYTCKKAITIDSLGNKTTYWYTEELQSPTVVEQFPEQLPGIPLRWDTENGDNYILSYEVSIINKNPDMSEYTVTIKEDTQVIDLKTLNGE